MSTANVVHLDAGRRAETAKQMRLTDRKIKLDTDVVEIEKRGKRNTFTDRLQQKKPLEDWKR